MGDIELFHHHSIAGQSQADAAMGPGERDAQALHRLVPIMRSLGVISAFGITLGPEPTRKQQLEAVAPEQMTEEMREELKRARVQALYDEYRDLLAASGTDYSEAQLRQMIPPDRLCRTEQGDG